MRLGSSSSTGDPEGEIASVSNHEPGKEELMSVIASFIGESDQTPPAYSAIKIDGQRAYKLARAGKQFIVEPRKITVRDIQLVDYNYPDVKMVTTVSSGTYIRSLVEDIGKALGTGAYTFNLNRRSIGDFQVSDAHGPKDLTVELINQYVQK
jgi:tRNA pseudouridine55 synthase